MSVGYAWALLDASEMDAAEARLQEAERWLTTTDATQLAKMVVVDKKQFRSLPASIANARAFRAQTLGDLASVMTYTQQALELLPEDEYYERGTAAALLGLGYWASGDLEAAYQSFATGVESLYKSGSILIVIGGSFLLANIRMTQGRLREAERICIDTLQQAMPPDKPILRGAAELYLGLSELAYERGNLIVAKEHLMSGKSLGQLASLPGHEYYWHVTEARIMQAEGNIDEALKLLQQAEGLYRRSPIPELRPISALKARLWLKQGRLAEALDWVHRRRLTVDDDLNFLQEYEHLTLARILIAQSKADGAKNYLKQASMFLERLLKAAETGKRIGSIIEISTLQALIYYAEGDLQPALALIRPSLKLAEAQQYVQVFIEEGSLLKNLLKIVAAGDRVPTYTDQLLTAFDNLESKPQSTQNWIDPLTDRELAVLRLLGTDLSGPEIARELVIALSTVRTHTKSIYDKLQVTSRRTAVKRATELGLI